MKFHRAINPLPAVWMWSGLLLIGTGMSQNSINGAGVWFYLNARMAPIVPVSGLVTHDTKTEISLGWRVAQLNGELLP